ncbi:MAG: hypothetical protein PF569_10150 [Candidatus Woesearchaeota archaeon]|nr:hypothetical protein [Candidatus Woesearchaeota archaeon]
MASISEGFDMIFNFFMTLSSDAWYGLILMVGAIAFSSLIARNLKKYAGMNEAKGLANLIAWFMTLIGLYFIVIDVRSGTLGLISSWLVIFFLIGATLGLFTIFKSFGEEHFEDSGLFKAFYVILLFVFFSSGLASIYKYVPYDSVLRDIVDSVIHMNSIALLALIVIVIGGVMKAIGNPFKKDGVDDLGDNDTSKQAREAKKAANNDASGKSSMMGKIAEGFEFISRKIQDASDDLGRKIEGSKK